MGYNYYFLFEFIINILSLSAFLYVGIRIASRYREYKRRELIFVGIAVIIISELYWTYPINSLLLFFNNPIIPLEIQDLISIVGLPIGIFFWLWAITDLMYKTQQKTILIISGVYFISFECFYIPIVILFPNSIRINPIIFTISAIYFISFLLIVLFTGLRFGYENLIADNPINRLQGKLMIIAFSLFSMVLIILVFITISLISQLLLIICFIIFYFSFVLPARIKQRILRKAGVNEKESVNSETISEGSNSDQD